MLCFQVQNDTGEALGSARLATDVADSAIDTLGRVDACRTDSLAMLWDSERKGMDNCQTRGPSIVQVCSAFVHVYVYM